MRLKVATAFSNHCGVAERDIARVRLLLPHDVAPYLGLLLACQVRIIPPRIICTTVTKTA